MQKTILTAIMVYFILFKGTAQTEYFDIPSTSALISHNKNNFSDAQKARDNQLLSQATVSQWQKTKNTCKQMMDKIDNRLTQAYIVLADVATMYNIASVMNDIYSSQSESLALLVKYPYAAGLFYDQEKKIIANAVDLYNLISLVLLSYGEINKLKVSSRKQVFMQIGAELGFLRNRCITLTACLKAVEFGDLYKNSTTWNFISQDKTKVKDILNHWKN